MERCGKLLQASLPRWITWSRSGHVAIRETLPVAIPPILGARPPVSPESLEETMSDLAVLGLFASIFEIVNN